MTHQPAISISNSIHCPFNRAGGRASNVLQRVNRLFLLLAFLEISCTHHHSDAARPELYPYFDRSYIADVVAPRDDDLRELVITFPVFDVEPSVRRTWVRKNAERTDSSIQLPTDGSGPRVGLRRIRDPDLYWLSIGPDDTSTTTEYKVRRLSGGWLVLQRTKSKIEPENKPAHPTADNVIL